MRLVTCNTMRDGIIVSGAFLVLGLVLIWAAGHLIPPVHPLPLVTVVLGVVSLLLAPVILVSTFVATVWPGSRKKMESCEH